MCLCPPIEKENAANLSHLSHDTRNGTRNGEGEEPAKSRALWHVLLKKQAGHVTDQR